MASQKQPIKSKAAKRPPLPGEPSRAESVARMLRVNQAGEYGAARIYQGQLDVLGKEHPSYNKIKEMAEQEQVHLKAFDAMLVERRVRPTLLQPFWNLAGYTLGAATALMGDKAAMACTVAVEEVIDEHYESQRKTLKKWEIEPELEQTIAKFQADEVDHKDTAIEAGAKEAPAYEALTGLIKMGCRTAIWLSKRV